MTDRRNFFLQEQQKKYDTLNLAELWGIGIKWSQEVIDTIPYHDVRSKIFTLTCSYRADNIYTLKRLNAKFATDTLFSDVKLLNKNT